MCDTRPSDRAATNPVVEPHMGQFSLDPKSNCERLVEGSALLRQLIALTRKELS